MFEKVLGLGRAGVGFDVHRVTHYGRISWLNGDDVHRAEVCGEAQSKSVGGL
jgi:hypothetical protein